MLGNILVSLQGRCIGVKGCLGVEMMLSDVRGKIM